MVLKLTGVCPSKKNRYRRSAGGGMHKPEKLQAQLDALSWQIKEQWGNRGTVEYPRAINFKFVNGEADLDNRVVTILDLLVLLKIIVDDNPHRVTKISAEVTMVRGEPESSEIEIVE
jgi:Holliday junction resolvase RusA-like endonuclease